jgi:hypothetical protein
MEVDHGINMDIDAGMGMDFYFTDNVHFTGDSLVERPPSRPIGKKVCAIIHPKCTGLPSRNPQRSADSNKGASAPKEIRNLRYKLTESQRIFRHLLEQ